MKSKIGMISLVILTIFGLSVSQMQAQDTAAQSKTTFSIETDPSTFAFGGYAVHFRIKAKNSKHLVFGAGAYSLDLPSVLVDMNKENKDKGWNVRINHAYSLFGEYYLKEANTAWFLGLQVGIQNFKNTNDMVAGKESKYSNSIIMPSVGYNWQPFQFPMYLKPWFGVGYTSKLSGSNSIDDLHYTISPLVPFITLHIGYTFNK